MDFVSKLLKYWQNTPTRCYRGPLQGFQSYQEAILPFYILIKAPSGSIAGYQQVTGSQSRRKIFDSKGQVKLCQLYTCPSEIDSDHIATNTWYSKRYWFHALLPVQWYCISSDVDRIDRSPKEYQTVTKISLGNAISISWSVCNFLMFVDFSNNVFFYIQRINSVVSHYQSMYYSLVWRDNTLLLVVVLL